MILMMVFDRFTVLKALHPEVRQFWTMLRCVHGWIYYFVEFLFEFSVQGATKKCKLVYCLQRFGKICGGERAVVKRVHLYCSQCVWKPQICQVFAIIKCIFGYDLNAGFRQIHSFQSLTLPKSILSNATQTCGQFHLGQRIALGESIILYLL